MVRQWLATSTPGPLRQMGEAGVVHQPLACTPQGDQLKISGVFGVFSEGKAVLSTADKDGKAIDEIVSLPASPVVPLPIDQSIPQPKGAASLVLDLRNANGTPVGRLASVALPEGTKGQVAQTK